MPSRVGDRVPQLGGVVPGGLHRVRVQGLQGAADLGVARVPDVGLGGGGGARVADDHLQALLLGRAGRRLVQLGDVEEPLVELAGRRSAGPRRPARRGCGRRPCGSARGRRSRPLARSRPTTRPLASTSDAVTGDEGDAVPALTPAGGQACRTPRQTPAVPRRCRSSGRAGHAPRIADAGLVGARRQCHGGRHGDRGRARSFHLSAQVSPLIRPRDLPHTYAPIPPVYAV